MTARNKLRGQEAYTLACWRAQGREDEARHYLEQLNKAQRIWGHPDYEMPEPLMTGEPDWLFCPVEGDPFLKHQRRAA